MVGADPNKNNRYTSFYLISAAVKNKNLEAIKLLISAGWKVRAIHLVSTLVEVNTVLSGLMADPKLRDIALSSERLIQLYTDRANFPHLLTPKILEHKDWKILEILMRNHAD